MSYTNQGFSSTENGFHITFPNNYTVSVQYGPYNYCANCEYSAHRTTKIVASGCINAEVAVLNAVSGAWYRGWPHGSDDDDIASYITPNQVLDILNWAAKQ